ncbi:flippase [Blautia marasmi]|uniref:flippase n=1 Tax=Blautia marasmi TaxID=1917868 RepID=UPI000CF25000|nr:flippase [Blautia marasmi]
MAQKSIKKNYIYNLAYQILTLITPLITTPYLSRVFGADGVGTCSYIESISSYFVLFATLGLTTFGQRETSYVLDERKKRSVIFWETNIIELIASALCIIAYVAFSFMQPNKELYLVLVLNLLSVIANISWFFQGLEEFGKIVLRNIIFKLVNIIYIFAVVKTKNDIILYLFGIAFFGLINNLSYWISVSKYVDKPVLRELHPTKHIKTVISLFVPTIAMQVYTVLDKTMIGVITKDSFENGYYEQALKISKLVLTIVTSLGTVMIPRIGYHYSKGNTEMVKEYMYRAYKFVWLCGIPLTFGLIAVSSNFVPWFFGDGYGKVVPLLGILSFLILAIGINNVTGMQYLIPTKRENTFSVTVIIGAATNFVMNFFLIQLFQATGAAIASVVAETAIAIIQIYIVRKELSPFEIIKCGTHYFIAGGIMFAILLLTRKFLSSSIVHTFELVMIGAVVYGLGLIVMKDEFLLSNINNISKKILKRD